MKRRGCIDCHILEPLPGQWIQGRCPACAQIEARRRERTKPPEAAQVAKPPEDQVLAATVARLRSYLARMAAEYPDCWKTVDRLRAERGLSIPRWPSWCFMPLAGSYAIASGGRDDAPAERMGGAIAAMGALAAWRPTQGIYRFDPTVAEAVWDTPLDGDIPSEILHHIPEWCIYVETPGRTYLDAPTPGFFAFLEHDANDNREELRLAIDDGAGKLMSAMPIHLDKGGIVAGIDAALIEGAKHAKKLSRPHDPSATALAEKLDIEGMQRLRDEYAGDIRWLQEVKELLTMPAEISAGELAPRVNLLLYLCSTNAEMAERGGPRLRPSKATLTKTKDGMRMFPAPKPVAWDVAYRLGAAIRHAQLAEHRKAGDGTHASPRPHIRRAHWHSFWTGAKAKPGQQPAERTLVLKWLPPIPVNVNDELEPVPTVHGVK